MTEPARQLQLCICASLSGASRVVSGSCVACHADHAEGQLTLLRQNTCLASL